MKSANKEIIKTLIPIDVNYEVWKQILDNKNLYKATSIFHDLTHETSTQSHILILTQVREKLII